MKNLFTGNCRAVWGSPPRHNSRTRGPRCPRHRSCAIKGARRHWTLSARLGTPSLRHRPTQDKRGESETGSSGSSEATLSHGARAAQHGPGPPAGPPRMPRGWRLRTREGHPVTRPCRGNRPRPPTLREPPGSTIARAKAEGRAGGGEALLRSVARARGSGSGTPAARRPVARSSPTVHVPPWGRSGKR